VRFSLIFYFVVFDTYSYRLANAGMYDDIDNNIHTSNYIYMKHPLILTWGRRGRDRVVVEFTTTCAINTNGGA
jgi:hypothetical protein